MMMTIARLPQPVIARVHGIATAAGCQLVAQCDLAVASVSAQFAVSGINVGLFCSTPVCRSAAMCRANRPWKCCSRERSLTRRRPCSVASSIASSRRSSSTPRWWNSQAKSCATPPSPCSTGKQMFYLQLEQGLEAAYAYAAEVMACNMMTEDVAEGIDAFMQKRPPQWKGR